MNKNILVSACLLGIPCQYDGQEAKVQFNKIILDKIKGYIVPVCPEQLSGLSTPREPVEIQNGDGFDVLNHTAIVKTSIGKDFTDIFIKGAQVVLDIAQKLNITKMITQKRSPSCSCNGIYDGHFTHTLINGYGVCAALLKQNGIELVDIEKFEQDFFNNNK